MQSHGDRRNTTEPTQVGANTGSHGDRRMATLDPFDAVTTCAAACREALAEGNFGLAAENARALRFHALRISQVVRREAAKALAGERR